MAKHTLGVAAMGGDAVEVVSRIQDLERRGIPAAWLTTGGAGLDGLTLFAAAAMNTQTILLGTCITPTWPRHPITTVQQTQVIAKLAPSRFRLGVGPSHKPSMESTYHFNFQTPLAHLREYIKIVKTLLTNGNIDFDGEHYHAHTSIPEPIEVPVMASALRRNSFALCGEEADGAISWVSPGPYLRDVALPAMKSAAGQANRPTPPLIVHAPVCVHDNVDEIYTAARSQIANYPRLPFYAQMLVDAGFPEAKEGIWSNEMLEAVVLSGNEQHVTDRLQEIFDWGAEEIIVSPILAGTNKEASRERTISLVADVAKNYC
ncbi:LLM class flavin-dependent oxidoreductase [SAR202 cluster bacterium AD-802-E10_MRT_200m]|nr:LLM class flavin-dependent oxidoreductase [SAR202 cluster bacterium AD-802-E10_MRT_200m]